MNAKFENIELTVLMPCLNEAETLGQCIEKALLSFAKLGVVGEVLVADNGSSDGSQAIATAAGARVVDVAQRGYGNALIAGINSSKGKYIIMGDADDSYDFGRLDGFLRELRSGKDLVLGNRFQGGIESGAMPFLHKYVGNPILSFIGRTFYKIKVGDFHCGLRGFKKESVSKLNLVCGGMEFASEMIVKASIAKLKIAEIPTTLAKDGRSRSPHLRTFRDGWRHLRFLMFYSPRWLFLYPGFVLMTLGLLMMLTLFFGPVVVGEVGFDVHTMLYSGAGFLVGLQMTLFSLIAKQIGVAFGVLARSSTLDVFKRHCTFEGGVLLGILLALSGGALAVWAVSIWASYDFGRIDATTVMRFSVFSVALVMAGVLIVIFSCLMAALDTYGQTPIRPSDHPIN
jgi:glycosyltransferase involved in cell wall biosynthesis